MISNGKTDNRKLCGYSVRPLAIFQDGGVLVNGTKDIAEAKTLYHGYMV